MSDIEKNFYKMVNGIKKVNMLFFISFIVLTISSCIYIRYTWVTSMNTTTERALESASIAATSLNGEMAKMLTGEVGDLGTVPYLSIKKRLGKLVKLEKGVRFAYISTLRNGKIYFLVDSEPAYSVDYSPAAQEYTEADEEDFKPFQTGKPSITKPTKDRWGTWTSAMIPMKDDDTGKVFAVFVMDYPAKTWEDNARNHTARASYIVLTFYLIWLAFFIVFRKNLTLKKVNIKIRSSEEKFSKAFHSNLAMMAISTIADGKYIDVNNTFLVTLGFERDEVIGRKIDDLDLYLDREKRDQLKKEFENNFDVQNVELSVKGKNGVVHSCLFSLDKIELSDVPCWITMMIDISERKKAEEEIFYLSYHDQLTGLYNRRFYEEELKKCDKDTNFPLSVILGDVNGLKLINDSFGHISGDELLKKTAEVIRNGCRKEHLVARIGGDEFVIIMPKTDESEAKRVIDNINKLASKEKVESVTLSISFGYATKYNEEEKMEAILKKAENNMYRNKLSKSSNFKGTSMDSILNTFYEKNTREGLHSYRVSKICERMGSALNLSQYEIVKLKMVALLHDIGKVAVDENILNKPGKLTGNEWEQIKRHSEIGYRIINTSSDMSDMASCVLAHHERWDGNGYPKGLKEEEIPLLSRIIAIVDAYDAMTSERSYRSALSEEIAIEELKKNAGTQFDSALIDIFIEKVLGKSNQESLEK